MDVIDLLQQFGLNKYEAEAYYALLARGPMTGYELGKHSAVPLSRSYEVLERLSQKGLALVQPGNVPRYAAEEPNRFLAQANSAFRARLEAITSLLTALSPADSAGQFWVVSGRENILTRTRSMIEEAQRAVELVVPADCYGDVAEAIAQAQSRGCHIYLPSITAGPGHETLVSRAVLLLADGRDMLAGTITPSQTCQAVVSSNEALVAAVTGWFAHQQQPHPVVGIDTGAVAPRDDSTSTSQQEPGIGWMAWEERKHRRLLGLSAESRAS